MKAVVTRADFPTPPDERRRARRGRGQPRATWSTTSWPRTRCSTAATPSPPSPRPTPHIAEDALDLIEVEYEVAAARRSTCARRWPKARRPARRPAHRRHDARPRQPDKPTNVAAHRQFEARRPRQGLRRGRRRRRARVHARRCPPGLHRAAHRDRALERGRPR